MIPAYDFHEFCLKWPFSNSKSSIEKIGIQPRYKPYSNLGMVNHKIIIYEIQLGINSIIYDRKEYELL